MQNCYKYACSLLSQIFLELQRFFGAYFSNSPPSQAPLYTPLWSLPSLQAVPRPVFGYVLVLASTCGYLLQPAVACSSLQEKAPATFLFKPLLFSPNPILLTHPSTAAAASPRPCQSSLYLIFLSICIDCCNSRFCILILSASLGFFFFLPPPRNRHCLLFSAQPRHLVRLLLPTPFPLFT